MLENEWDFIVLMEISGVFRNQWNIYNRFLFLFAKIVQESFIADVWMGSTIMEQTFVHILAQFLFTTSERELNYYYQKVNIWYESRVAKQLKT